MANERRKRCPSCGTIHAAGAFECEACGTDLTGVRPMEQEEDRQLEAENVVRTPGGKGTPVRVCSCGAENPAQARKCAACGEDISDVLPTEAGAATGGTWHIRSLDGHLSAVLEDGVRVIGRTEGFSGYLESRMYVSRRHARLTLREGVLTVTSLNARNHTFVNDRELPEGQEIALQSGDILALGGIRIDGELQEQAAYLCVERRP